MRNSYGYIGLVLDWIVLSHLSFGYLPVVAPSE